MGFLRENMALIRYRQKYIQLILLLTPCGHGNPQPLIGNNLVPPGTVRWWEQLPSPPAIWAWGVGVGQANRES